MNLRTLSLGTILGACGVALALHTFLPPVAEGAPTTTPPAYPAKPTEHAPHPTSSSAPAGSASGKALEAPDHRFDLPPLAKEVIPTEHSDLPKADEWKTAPAIEVTRRSPASRWCTAYRVREYLKVHCNIVADGVRQLAGNPKDVQLFVVPKGETGILMAAPNGGEVIFPLRRNEGRLFQFFAIFDDGWGFSPSPSVVVDSAWPDGLATPSVILR